MTAVVYQLRDFQNPKDIERMQRELEKEAAKILHDNLPELYIRTETVPYGGQGIDGMTFTAPDKDSA